MASPSDDPPYQMGLTVLPAVVLGDGVVFEETCAACEVQAASGSDYGREHTCGSRRGSRRVSHDSIVWERIPEQTVCICAHVKGVHSGPAFASPNRYACESGCRCPGFHDVDHPMPWANFAGRFLETDELRAPPKLDAVFEPDKAKLRRRAALSWAWKQSGLALNEPRTWALWMHESKRVWRAWRDAGSPIIAFGKETSFGVASIPALEDR